MVHIIIILILYLRELRLKWVICSRSYKLGSDKGMDLNPQVCLTPKCMFFFPVIKVRSFVRQASKTFASSGVLIINSVLSKYRTIPLQVLEKKKKETKPNPQNQANSTNDYISVPYQISYLIKSAKNYVTSK